MDVSETKSDGLLREYKIVITTEEIEGEVTKKLEELAATVKMPGFRPGKVPLSIVKTRFGDQARGEAIKTALDEGARQAIEGNDLKLASQPKVDIQSYEESKDLEASLACEIMPVITVPDLLYSMLQYYFQVGPCQQLYASRRLPFVFASLLCSR